MRCSVSNSTSHIKCFYTNANSLIQKIDELRYLVEINKYDIIAVTETWAHTEIRDTELFIEGFNMYRVYRKVTRGGGVVLYIKEPFRSVIEKTPCFDKFEDCVWCTVKMYDLQLLVGVCYRSPASTTDNNMRLLDMLEKAVNGCTHDRILVVGDFNYREIDYNNYDVKADNNSDACKFFDKSLDLYLVQHVTQATRKREGTCESVLDYIFTDEEMLVDNLRYEAPLGKSDHVSLVWDYIIQVEDSISKQKKLNYSKGNYNKITADLKEVNWDLVLNDESTEGAWNKFKDIVQKSVKANIPATDTSRKKKASKAWLTKATKRNISKRNKAWKSYRDKKTEVSYTEYKKLRNEANRRIKADRASYRKKVLKSFKGNPKKFYGYMRRMKTVKEKVHQIINRNGQFTTSDG